MMSSHEVRLCLSKFDAINTAGHVSILRFQEQKIMVALLPMVDFV